MGIEEIAGAIEACASRGLGLAAHAIGDGAVRTCLDAATQTRALARGERHALRIEHCELVDEADVEEMDLERRRASRQKARETRRKRTMALIEGD